MSEVKNDLALHILRRAREITLDREERFACHALSDACNEIDRKVIGGTYRDLKLQVAALIKDYYTADDYIICLKEKPQWLSEDVWKGYRVAAYRGEPQPRNSDLIFKLRLDLIDELIRQNGGTP